MYWSSPPRTRSSSFSFFGCGVGRDRGATFAELPSAPSVESLQSWESLGMEGSGLGSRGNSRAVEQEYRYGHEGSEFLAPPRRTSPLQQLAFFVGTVLCLVMFFFCAVQARKAITRGRTLEEIELLEKRDLEMWRFWAFAFYLPWAQLLLFHALGFLVITCCCAGEEASFRPAPAPKRRPFLWMLEPARLIAAVHITVYHDFSMKETDFSRWGFAWISFFLVLSGFVGGYQLLSADPDLSRTSTPGHIWKRIKRLWPYYLVYVFMQAAGDRYFSKLYMSGSVVPDLQDIETAVRKLASVPGLIYLLGLQTVFPVFDPKMQFVTMTCWFVPTLLLCEALLPMWMRIIVRLWPLGDEGEQRDERCVPGLNRMWLLACGVAVAVPTGVAWWFITSAHVLQAEKREILEYHLRFSPTCHWAQVLLGAVSVRVFVQDQDAKGTVASIGMWWQRAAPWLAGAVFCGIAVSGMLNKAFFLDYSNTMILFINDGVASPIFAVGIICLAQASSETQIGSLWTRFTQILGNAAYPTYLFIYPTQDILNYWFMAAFGRDVRTWCDSKDGCHLGLVYWLRVPFIILVQYLLDTLFACVKQFRRSKLQDAEPTKPPLLPPSRFEETNRQQGQMGWIQGM